MACGCGTDWETAWCQDTYRRFKKVYEILEDDTKLSLTPAGKAYVLAAALLGNKDGEVSMDTATLL